MSYTKLMHVWQVPDVVSGQAPLVRRIACLFSGQRLSNYLSTRELFWAPSPVYASAKWGETTTTAYAVLVHVAKEVVNTPE